MRPSLRWPTPRERREGTFSERTRRLHRYAGPDDATASSDASELIDATDAEHLRLHTGSFAALLVAGASASIDLGNFLPLVARGGSVLLATPASTTLTVSPRVLQERRLGLLAPPPLSAKATLAMLSFCAERSLEWPAEEGEWGAEGAAAAFGALEAAPGARAVLVEADEHAKWLKRSKRLLAAGVLHSAECTTATQGGGLRWIAPSCDTMVAR